MHTQGWWIPHSAEGGRHGGEIGCKYGKSSSHDGVWGKGRTRVGPWRKGYDTPEFGGKKRKGRSKWEELPEKTGESVGRNAFTTWKMKNQPVSPPPPQNRSCGRDGLLSALFHSVLSPVWVNLLIFLSCLSFLCNVSLRLVRKYMGFSVKDRLHEDATARGSGRSWLYEFFQETFTEHLLGARKRTDKVPTFFKLTFSGGRQIRKIHNTW